MDAQGALSGAYALAGRFGSADAAYRRVVGLLEAQGRGQTRLAAVVLNNWSAMLQDAGRHHAAVPLSERAVRIARDRDTENGASLTQLVTYGSALTVVGRPAEAVPVAGGSAGEGAARGLAAAPLRGIDEGLEGLPRSG